MNPNFKITTTKKNNIAKTLGPVTDLESYVKSDWWKHLFNAYYLKTDGDVVNDDKITCQEIDLFTEALKPQKDSYILDLCCGHGRHSIELARRGYSNVHGLDRSHYLITKAKAVAKKENLNIVFKEGDARKIVFPTNYFDYIILPGNSFGYFESIDDDKNVLDEMKRILKSNGRILIDITDGEYMKHNYEPRSWEWIDKNFFVCRERSLSKDSERLISREVITHVTKGVMADQFYAERLYTRENLINLLKSNGFTDVEFSSEIFTSSERNMDLGMMGKRIIFTGTVVKTLDKTPVKKESRKKIIVLLGDPKRPDIIKPESKFDINDFHTIDELKKSLKMLKKYKFSYLDDHSKIIHDLSKLNSKDKYILNLCDEGFNNDPKKELHIPSLLEMFNLKYSGGTPQCLAYCYDKSLVRGIAREIDVPVPDAFLIKPDDISFIEMNLSFPLIVKPNYGDSSFGITKDSVCSNIQELEKAVYTLRSKLGYNAPIIVEQYLTGKDLSVGIIGNPPDIYEALPIIEEDYSLLPPDLPRICGYEAKWDPTSPYWQIKSIKADIPPETESFMIFSCIRLFERLECKDYARFDWRMDHNNTPRLLEVNPNPGWCWDGHLAKMAALQNTSYSGMLEKIIDSFLSRHSNN